MDKNRISILVFSCLVLTFFNSIIVSAELCSPFTLNMTINPSSMVMSGGCSGDVSLAPDSDDLVWVRLYNSVSHALVYEQSYGSGLLGASNDFNFYPDVAIDGGSYYLNISWDRIRYDDMGNPSLNGLFDSGGYQTLCPTVKTGSKMYYYTGTSGLSGCNYDSLIRDTNYSSKGSFSTGTIETFVNDGCTGSYKLDDDFFDNDFSVGSRVPEGSSYHPTFSCNAGVGAVFESYWSYTHICQSGFGYDDVLAVSSCSNGASAPSGVCTYASSHSIRSNSFLIAYNNDSKFIVDFASIGLDFNGSLSWVSITDECFTDGFFNFKPEEEIVFDSSNSSNPVLKLNISVTDNVSLQQNPSNCTTVFVTIRWLKDGLPTTCDGFCPEKVVSVTNTGYQVVDSIPVLALEPNADYSVELEYQQDGGEAVYSEDSDNSVYVDEDDVETCDNGVCDSVWGENAFNCGADCNPALVSGSGSSVVTGDRTFVNPEADGTVGTGSEYLYTGDFLSDSSGALIIGGGGLDWSFIFINNVVII